MLIALVCLLTLSAHLFRRHVLFGFFLHHFWDGHFKVFLGDVDTTLTQGVHACLGTDTLLKFKFQKIQKIQFYLWFSARSASHFLGHLAQIDATGQVHFSRVNLQNIDTGLKILIETFDLNKFSNLHLRWEQGTRFCDQCGRDGVEQSRECRYDLWP